MMSAECGIRNAEIYDSLESTSEAVILREA